jgi:hypothetical protein
MMPGWMASTAAVPVSVHAEIVFAAMNTGRSVTAIVGIAGLAPAYLQRGSPFSGMKPGWFALTAAGPDYLPLEPESGDLLPAGFPMACSGPGNLQPKLVFLVRSRWLIFFASCRDFLPDKHFHY